MESAERLLQVLLIVESALDGDANGLLGSDEARMVEQVEHGDTLQDFQLEFMLPCLGKALDDGLDLVPMAPVTLDAQPVAECRPCIVVEVVEPIERTRLDGALGELSQGKRLVGEEEAEERPLVLAEA